MRNLILLLLISTMQACNNQADNSGDSLSDGNNTANKKEEESSDAAGSDCGNSLLFRKGAEIHTTSYDGQGKIQAKQVSIVTKVYEEGGMTISDIEMKNTDENGANEKSINARYKCDGKLLYVDLAGFLPDSKEGMSIETSGLQFPFNVTVGETLPDADYSINMSSGGKTRKITSHVKDRKVETKESVTTPAGTFECYKISSVIETDMDIPGMDEKSKMVMEEMRKKMGKNTMTFWYAPKATIIKMEFHMGSKLVTRSEVTSIKK